jgi:kinetochore protein Nuf2
MTSRRSTGTMTTTTTANNVNLAMTYPIIPWSEIQALSSNALSVNLSSHEINNPTTQTVVKLAHALLELLTGVPREEVGNMITRQLENMENPELFKDALPLVVLYRELERLATMSMGEFTFNDLIQPTPNRLQKLLSAMFNYGRFREDVLRQASQEQVKLSTQLEEIQSLTHRHQQLQQQIKISRENKLKDAPERAKVEEEITSLELKLRGLGVDIRGLEAQVEDVKKKIEQCRKQTDSTAFELITLKNEKEEIESKMVTSPERIQNELKTNKKRLEQEKEEIEQLKLEEREQKTKLTNLKNALSLMDPLLVSLNDVEGQSNKAKQAEEEMRSRRAAIDSHSYTLRELAQREQEAQREADLAEDRYKRQSQQRFMKLETAQQKLKQAQRERDAYDRNLDDANRRAARAKSQVLAARSEYVQIKSMGEERLQELQQLHTNFLSTFENYAKTVEEALNDVKKSSLEGITNNNNNSVSAASSSSSMSVMMQPSLIESL